MNTKTNHSNILILLSLAQMGKFFSHFGVRTLLVLYLVEDLHYLDTQAFGINAVFCGLTELGGIFGGMMADRYLGLKRAMMAGGWLLGLGYFSLFFENALFLSMGIIIVGSSLFSGNITALLGEIYSQHENENRKKGFTLFYMFQNFGALVSTFVCGLIALHFGYRWGFAVASVGILLSNIMLHLNKEKFVNLQNTSAKNSLIMMPIILCIGIFIIGTAGVWSEKVVLMFLPWITGAILLFFMIKILKDKRWEKEEVYKLATYLTGLILFFGVEDQICSSLLLFSEREANHSFFGWEIPSSFITLSNPIIILIFGAYIAKKDLQMKTPFFLTGLSFGLLACLCFLHIKLSILGVLGVVAAISISEIMIGPLVMSVTSDIALKGSPGIIMGMVPVAFSLAYQLSGGLSKIVAVDDQSFLMHTYGTGFGMVSLLMLGSALLMQFLMPKTKQRFIEVIS